MFSTTECEFHKTACCLSGAGRNPGQRTLAARQTLHSRFTSDLFPSYCFSVISINSEPTDLRQTALLVYQEDHSQKLFEKKFLFEAGIGLEAVWMRFPAEKVLFQTDPNTTKLFFLPSENPSVLAWSWLGCDCSLEFKLCNDNANLISTEKLRYVIMLIENHEKIYPTSKKKQEGNLLHLWVKESCTNWGNMEFLWSEENELKATLSGKPLCGLCYAVSG